MCLKAIHLSALKQRWIHSINSVDVYITFKPISMGFLYQKLKNWLHFCLINLVIIFFLLGLGFYEINTIINCNSIGNDSHWRAGSTDLARLQYFRSVW